MAKLRKTFAGSEAVETAWPIVGGALGILPPEGEAGEGTKLIF